MNPSSHAYNSVNDAEKEETRVSSRHGEIILLFYIITLSKGLLILPFQVVSHTTAMLTLSQVNLNNSRIKEILVEIMNFNSVKQNDVF